MATVRFSTLRLTLPHSHGSIQFVLSAHSGTGITEAEQQLLALSPQAHNATVKSYEFQIDTWEKAFGIQFEVTTSNPDTVAVSPLFDGTKDAFAEAVQQHGLATVAPDTHSAHRIVLVLAAASAATPHDAIAALAAIYAELLGG